VRRRERGPACAWACSSFERLLSQSHRLSLRFRGGLVFKAHRLVYHSTLGLRVITKKKKCDRLSLHPSTKITHLPRIGVRIGVRGGAENRCHPAPPLCRRCAAVFPPRI